MKNPNKMDLWIISFVCIFLILVIGLFLYFYLTKPSYKILDENGNEVDIIKNEICTTQIVNGSCMQPENSDYPYNNIFTIYTAKKDITQEFLDENCRCEMKILIYACVNPSEHDKIRDDCGDLDKEKNIGKCVQWTCFDKYEVTRE